MEARYLTVDLVIESNSDLTPLTDFLEGKVFFLWKKLANERSSVGLETNICNTASPEEDICRLLDLIDALPNNLQRLWKNSERKVMDIGYECGTMDSPINSPISSTVVHRLAQWSCAINIRIYHYVERPENLTGEN